MLRPGQITLQWDGQGHLKLAAPMDQKETCYIMLAEAVKAIVNYQAGLALPGNVPIRDLYNRN